MADFIDIYDPESGGRISGEVWDRTGGSTLAITLGRADLDNTTWLAAPRIARALAEWIIDVTEESR